MAAKKKPVRRAPGVKAATAPRAPAQDPARPAARATSVMLSSSSHSGRGANNFDLLRLLAAAFVVFGHCFLVVADEAPLLNAEAFADWGNLGVVMFFAISGFLVSRSWVSDPRVIAFGVKRFLRIMPALVVALLVTALILGPLVTSKGFSEYLQDPFTKVFILNNSVMWTSQGLPGVFTDNPIQLVNLPLWTLAPEVKCYILVALLGSLGFYRRWSGAVVVAIGTLLSLLLIEPLRNAIPGGDRAVAMMFNTQATAREVDAVAGGAAFEYAQVFAAFFLGAALFTLRRFVPLRWDLFGAALVVVAVASFSEPHTGRVALTMLIPYLVLVLAYRTHDLVSLPSWMGDYSYGIYIFAFPIQQAVVHWVDPGNGWVVLLITAPVVTALAALSWRFVEAPALTFKQRIIPALDDAADAGRHPDAREALAPAGS